MSPDVILNDGHSMPQLGLGLMRFGSEAETAAVLASAADAGYRLFDSAAVYGNEQQVGEGLRQSGLARDDMFVTTKLWNSEQGRDKPRAALEGSLQRLGLDRVDLYLIHWPLPMDDLYVETWRALIALREEGLVRSIGVSNFTEAHLGRLIAEIGIVPAVNQIEIHPRFQQRGLHAFHREHGIVSQAWSPFGGGGTGGGSPCLASRCWLPSRPSMRAHPRKWCCAGSPSPAHLPSPRQRARSISRRTWRRNRSISMRLILPRLRCWTVPMAEPSLIR